MQFIGAVPPAVTQMSIQFHIPSWMPTNKPYLYELDIENGRLSPIQKVMNPTQFNRRK
jgi:hypothetical protein